MCTEGDAQISASVGQVFHSLGASGMRSASHVCRMDPRQNCEIQLQPGVTVHLTQITVQIDLF
jgi:hypothetical protein